MCVYLWVHGHVYALKTHEKPCKKGETGLKGGEEKQERVMKFV